ncbi:hypothetical protein INR49_015303 [Caranx melampygus]|nr:hypothetical protein INR49_015303 [Caranx melampygus]
MMMFVNLLQSSVWEQCEQFANFPVHGATLTTLVCVAKKKKKIKLFYEEIKLVIVFVYEDVLETLHGSLADS